MQKESTKRIANTYVKKKEGWMLVIRMLMGKILKSIQSYDVTLFQTPQFGQTKGYRQVYRLTVSGEDHDDVLAEVYRMFNVPDLVPKDYRARYVSTGDILLIDEGIYGQFFYRLSSDGWERIHRMHVR
ncbi:hypothetical protein CI793_01805 [Anoxybacillus ayderensis]|nr:hypothetical protein CI793_01805 [Anoxybacillus ayderensis]